MLSVALLLAGDAAVGRKVTATVVEAPDPRVVVAGAPTENWSAFAPVSVNGVVSVTLDPLTFVIVKLLNAEPPTTTLLKSQELGAAVIADAPLTVMSVSIRGNS
jgi:hypothetical protein